MPNFQTICQIHDVPEGSARMYVVGKELVGIFHVEGQFFALDNRCPHAGASLAHGIVEGDEVACRIHHWRFSIRDGRRLDESCPGTNARCFPLRIVDQDVQIDLGQPG